MHLSPTSKLGYLSFKCNCPSVKTLSNRTHQRQIRGVAFEIHVVHMTRMQAKKIFRYARPMCCVSVVLNAFCQLGSHIKTLYSSHRR